MMFFNIQSSEELIWSLSKKPALIVVENPQLERSSVTVFKGPQKLTFDVNLKKTDLGLSSHLLKLAHRVNQ
jgi:hypothetical protein